MEKRTTQQNRTLHSYFEMLAETLNEAGLDMKIVLKPEVQISWTKENVKEYLWKPLQKALLQKESTTELEKQRDIDLIYDNLHRHLIYRFGDVAKFPPFPSLDSQNQGEVYK
jgi:hypothetical protein